MKVLQGSHRHWSRHLTSKAHSAAVVLGVNTIACRKLWATSYASLLPSNFELSLVVCQHNTIWFSRSLGFCKIYNLLLINKSQH